MPNAAAGTNLWELLDLGGAEFVVGTPGVPSETDLFGVGFIKFAEEPHPLADGMDAKGIRFTYTWFGGPWMEPDPYDWGAYSSDIQGSTVVDVMMRVWVSYPWGMPILINDVFQKSNTYDTAGPYNITCKLEDDGIGITEEDSVYLVYKVDGGAENWVELGETSPGSGIFQADIAGQPLGSEIAYWIYTVDDMELVNQCLPKLFNVIEPAHPTADILFIVDGLSDRITAYEAIFANNNIWYETWDVAANMGIDNSVVNFGWETIIIASWGISCLPAEDEPTPFTDFLDNGYNLCLIDQDYFYGNSLPDSGEFSPGEFAYDYLGINEYWNDPNVGGVSTADVIYSGEYDDPISGTFLEPELYETYWDTTGIHMDESSLWADYITVSGASDIFYGINDAFTYGCSYESGFKTVFLAFMAEAACEYDTVEGVWIPNDDFNTLLMNIFAWFGTNEVDPITIGFTPENYSLSQNYPNPFNPNTSISFVLRTPGEVSLKVYNLLGEEVASLVDGRMSAGPHTAYFDASDLSSGIYYYNLTAGDFVETKKMILLK